MIVVPLAMTDVRDPRAHLVTDTAAMSRRMARKARGARHGGPLGGVVQPYEPQYSDGTFPVRFDDGIWRKMNINDVTVVAAAPSDPRRSGGAR